MGFDSRLGSVLNFDEVDLVANRRGDLSPEQARMLGATARVGRRVALRGLVITAFAIAVGAGLLIWNANAAPRTVGRTETLAILAILAGFGVVIALIIMGGARRSRGGASTTLQRVEGPVEWDWDALIGADVLVVGGVRFRVDRLLAQTVKVGDDYSVNWIESVAGPAILSLERA